MVHTLKKYGVDATLYFLKLPTLKKYQVGSAAGTGGAGGGGYWPPQYLLTLFQPGVGRLCPPIPLPQSFSPSGRPDFKKTGL